jgi:hypothetical protein
VSSVGVSEVTALGVEDAVEAGDEHVGSDRANNASLTCASTSPGEEDPEVVTTL